MYDGMCPNLDGALLLAFAGMWYWSLVGARGLSFLLSLQLAAGNQ
jgi:hypothetical protein